MINFTLIKMYLHQLYNKIKFNLRLKKMIIKRILIIISVFISLTIILNNIYAAVTYTDITESIEYGQSYDTSNETITDGYNQMYHYSNYQLDITLPETLDNNYHYVIVSYVKYNYGLYYRSYVCYKTSSADYNFYLYPLFTSPYNLGNGKYFNSINLVMRDSSDTSNIGITNMWKSIDGDNWVSVSTSSHDGSPILPYNSIANQDAFSLINDNGNIYMADLSQLILWTNKDLNYTVSDQRIFDEPSLYFGAQDIEDLTYIPPTSTPTEYTSPTPLPDEYEGIPLNPDGTLPDFDAVLDDAFNFPPMPALTNIPALIEWIAACTVQIFAGLLSLLNYLLLKVVNVVNLMGNVVSKIPFVYHAMMIIALIFAILTRILRGAG